MSDSSTVPYQLRMFDRSLKKRQKVDLIRRHLGDIAGKRCLLVTGGDNNGAMNYRFREHGGRWMWAEAQGELRAEIERLLGEPVHAVDPESLPFGDDEFDVVVAIDVHEHLSDPAPFTGELVRVARAGGRVIATTPNGDGRKIGCRIKALLGMTPEVYGHERWGYRTDELADMLRAAGLQPLASSSYSGLFTEMVELAINVAYVKLLNRGGDHEGDEQAIAPGTEDDLRKVGRSFRLYRLVYPVLKAVSLLDVLDPTTGYAVVVEAGVPSRAAAAVPSS